MECSDIARLLNVILTLFSTAKYKIYRHLNEKRHVLNKSKLYTLSIKIIEKFRPLKL